LLTCPALLLIASCATTTAPSDGVEFRSANWDNAIETGFAVTPVSAAPEITDSAEATAQFTNELYTGLQISLPQTAFVSPHQTLTRLDTVGRNAHSRLRSLRRDLYQNDVLDQENTAGVSRDLQSRYALLGWFEEVTQEITKGGGFYSFGAGDAPPGSGTERTVVQPIKFEQVDGHAVAIVVDLQEAEVLWRGSVEYKTNQTENVKGAFEQELDRARADAAIRLADHVGEY